MNQVALSLRVGSRKQNAPESWSQGTTGTKIDLDVETKVLLLVFSKMSWS